MTDTPLVSIVIPTYNHGHFLKTLLDSLRNQTYPHWEAIIVNNYSQDDTIQIIKDFADPRISLLNFSNNGIIAASRNYGISQAKGDWICFLDSDDWWTPNKLQVCIDRFQEDVDLIFHDLKIVREQSALLGWKYIKGRKLKKPVLTDLLVNGSAFATSSVVVRKNLLERIGGIDQNPEMVGTEDYNTWLRIAEITDRFCYIPKSLGYYMHHAQGISRKDMSIPVKTASAAFIDVLSSEKEQKRFQSLIEYTRGHHAFLKHDFNEAHQSLLFSLRYGRTELKLKSLYFLVSLLFKKTS